jgi:hypothetical protein
MNRITQSNAFGQAPEQQCDSLKAEVADVERTACVAGRHCSIPTADPTASETTWQRV